MERSHDGRETSRSRGGAVWVIVVVGLLAASMSRADDDIVVEEGPVGVQEGGRVVNARIGGRVAQPNLTAHYDSVLFGIFDAARMPFPHPAAKPAPQQASPRDRVGLIADEVLRRIDAVVGLTAAQRDRLRQAIDGDLEPAIEQIEADRRRYADLPPAGDQFAQQATYARLQEDALGGRELLARAWDSDSLLQKILPTTLDAEQDDRLHAALAARLAGRWGAAVAVALDTLDESLGLTTKQHAALEQALLARQPRLRVLLPPGLDNSHTRFQLVCIQLAAMDEADLKPLVTDRQWAALEGWRQNGHTMLPHFVKQGWYEP
jgi:hypothetical protein